MIKIPKKQLRYEIATLENLINRCDGEISLWTAHDNLSVELDFYRGACSRRKRKTIIENIEKEYQSWML